jgi:uncharacterized protein YaeQ|tara:strand:+ start:2334 stop:2939 length:606 start_codon:yes stop_codon:yes gene_type:complete
LPTFDGSPPRRAAFPLHEQIPMALKSTIFKADLQISDMDRHYYQQHALTIARHPSETDERMMIRVLAFALNASEALAFGKGLSDTDEPDLWQKDLTGAIEVWVEVGQPDDRAILKACGRADKVLVYSYSSTSHIWWGQTGSRVDRAKNLKVINIPAEASQALAALAQRTMQLQCTIQDGQIWLGANENMVLIEPETVKDFA